MDGQDKIFIYICLSNKVINHNLTHAYNNIGKFLSCCPVCPEGMTMKDEKNIEQALVTAVKNAGGKAFKFISPGYDGMPDRLVLFPKGKVAFIELKATNKKPRPLQLSRHRMLHRLGFRVYVVDDMKQIGGIIDEIRTT